MAEMATCRDFAGAHYISKTRAHRYIIVAIINVEVARACLFKVILILRVAEPEPRPQEPNRFRTTQIVSEPGAWLRVLACRTLRNP